MVKADIGEGQTVIGVGTYRGSVRIDREGVQRSAESGAEILDIALFQGPQLYEPLVRALIICKNIVLLRLSEAALCDGGAAAFYDLHICSHLWGAVCRHHPLSRVRGTEKEVLGALYIGLSVFSQQGLSRKAYAPAREKAVPHEKLRTETALSVIWKHEFVRTSAPALGSLCIERIPVLSLIGDIDAVYNEVDPYTPMSDYVTISGLIKIFINNNNGLKFGSSKQTGYADFDMPSDGDLPLTSVKIDVENYSSSKNAHLRIELEDDNVDIILEPSEVLSYSFVPHIYEDNKYWFALETLDTYDTTDEETDEPVSIKCDPRTLLHTLQLQYGQDAFEWKQLGGNAGDILSFAEAQDILEPFNIVDTNFIVSGSSTIEDNTLELGVSAEVDDTAIII